METGNTRLTFGVMYHQLWHDFNSSLHSVNFDCRGNLMAREMVNANLVIEISQAGACVFSHPTHRVVPMRFLLAEMCAMMAGTNDIATMETYNKGMRKYSNDGVTLGASYGEKLDGQLSNVVQRLQRDPYSRQACCSILQKDEMLDLNRTHIPCNVFLQFIMRNNVLTLVVTSRSSDFVTGFSIDTVHWQLLLLMVANSIGKIPGEICYNIGSLHIYEKDMAIVSEWDVTKMFGVPYQHFITTKSPVATVQYNCKKEFKGGMSTDELCDLLGMDGHSKAICRYNDEMFKLYRNKLER